MWSVIQGLKNTQCYVRRPTAGLSYPSFRCLKYCINYRFSQFFFILLPNLFLPLFASFSSQVNETTSFIKTITRLGTDLGGSILRLIHSGERIFIPENPNLLGTCIDCGCVNNIWIDWAAFFILSQSRCAKLFVSTLNIYKKDKHAEIRNLGCRKLIYLSTAYWKRAFRALERNFKLVINESGMRFK